MENRKSRRIARTKERIQNAMLEQLENGELHRISISRLCEKAGINRTTFYNHYGSQEDVLREMSMDYLRNINDVLRGATPSDYQSIYDQVALALRYMEEHLQLSRLLLNSISGPELPEALMTVSLITETMNTYIPEDTEPRTRRATLTFVLSGIYSLLREWLCSSERISAEEEARLILELSAKILRRQS